jgi:hypothetical protein
LKQLRNKEDWEWYTQGLDVSGKYHHRHNGEPERYPCIVASNFWDDPNGPYTYDHDFYYQEEYKCESCGHRSMKYPLSEDQVKGIN